MLDSKPTRSVITLPILLIPIVITIIYMALVLRFTMQQNDGYVGALLDDTWIHIRFAKHISEGRGLAYNDGVITPGATSPLWVISLGAVYAITNPDIDTQVHIAIIMSAIGNVLAVGAINGFGWWVTGRAWIGLLAGVITALTGRFIWMGLSGMEITTFTALCIFSLWSHIADVRDERVFSWRTGIILALATLARPEGYLLAALVGVNAFVLMPWRAYWQGEAQFASLREYWHAVRSAWRGILTYVMLAGTYPLVCLLVTGYPLPNTYRVKSQLGEETPRLLYAYLWTPLQDHGALLIVLMLLGIGFILWRAWKQHEPGGFAWGLWPPLFVIAVLFMGSQHFVLNNSRYVAPAIPFHALAAAVGVWVLARIIRARSSIYPRAWIIPVIVLGAASLLIQDKDTTVYETLVVVFAGVLLWALVEISSQSAALQRLTGFMPFIIGAVLAAMAFFYGAKQGALVANDVYQLRQMHVTAGEWFSRHSQPGHLIALNDVGAIAHISDRDVLDLIGLVSPEVIDAVAGTQRETCEYDLQLARLMLQKPPALIGVFPWFFPCLTGWPGALQPFNVFTITGPTVIAGGELVVYWPVWENWPVQAAMPQQTILTSAKFEQGLHLAGYNVTPAEDGLSVDLWWRATQRPEDDYTVFVHLIDASGRILAQHDSPPQGGQFHTRWWRSGDMIRDTHTLAAGEAHNAVALRIGWYPTSGGPNLRLEGSTDEFIVLPLP